MKRVTSGSLIASRKIANQNDSDRTAKPVKVLHLSHTSIPNDPRILREIEALSESSDLEVHAVGFQEPGKGSEPRGDRIRELRLRSSQMSRLPKIVRHLAILMEMNAKFLGQILRMRPKVVHCHDYLPLPAAAIAKLLTRTAVVYDAHELESGKAGQTPILARETLAIERLCWPAVDGFITVSPSIASWYARNLEPKRSICVLNSPVTASANPQSSHGGRPGIREDLGLQQADPLFVYVGYLTFGRGIELLLSASTSFEENVHIAFVGEGELVEEIVEAGVARGNIHYCPKVPHDQLVEYISSADGAFCLVDSHSLSDYLCLPNKLFEYAFAGVPVIASAFPDIEAVVNEYGLGVCIPREEEAIARAVGQLVQGNFRGPKKDLAPLSWETQAANLRALYSDLLASRN